MDFSTEQVVIAFSLTLFAGLATGIGSVLAFFTHHTNTKFLSTSLGFSAGVMIYVSFVEIFVKARESLVSVLGNREGTYLTVGSFFGGIFLIAIIDKLIPSFENPHEMHSVEEIESQVAGMGEKERKLLRMGVFTALAIAIHNFPEGLATFTSALTDPALGVSIAVAIAIHNIPEGIAVSVPVFYATRSRRRAFLYSFISGVAEPVGALVGYVILMRFVNGLVFGVLFAGVAGIMVFISLDELLPAAQKFGEHHLSIYGMIAGMIVMALSLLLLM
ncbi:MAG: zinc transporter ZupT [Chitinispirillaceae bacterium]